MPPRRVAKAGDRIRTGDLNLGKVALYQLSYTRSLSDQLVQPELLEPPVGLEPTTAALRMRCSTTELRWQVVSHSHDINGDDRMEPEGFEPSTS